MVRDGAGARSMIAQPKSDEVDRLERAKQLAGKLFFTLEQQGDRYSLFGTAGLFEGRA